MVGSKLNKKGDVSFDWVVIIIILLIALFLVGYFIVSFILGQQTKVAGTSNDLMYTASINEVSTKIQAACTRWEKIVWRTDMGEYKINVKPVFDEYKLPTYEVVCDVMSGKYGVSTGTIIVSLDRTTYSLSSNSTIKLTNTGKEPITSLAVFSYNNSNAIYISGRDESVNPIYLSDSALNIQGKKLFLEGYSISETNPLNKGENVYFTISPGINLLNTISTADDTFSGDSIVDYMNQKQYIKAANALKNEKSNLFGGFDSKYPYAIIDPKSGEINYYIYIAMLDKKTNEYVPIKTIEMKK